MQSTSSWQPAILHPVPAIGRYLVFDARVEVDAHAALGRLASALPAERSVVGLGQPLVLRLRTKVAGLRAFPAVCGPGCAFPSTQGELWVFLGGANPSEVHEDARAARAALGDGFVLREEVPGFKYKTGRDLSEYEDGTENPKDERAIAAAIVSGGGAGIDGSSFVAVQRWVHDLDGFARFSAAKRDACIGRKQSTNEELVDAPAWAHVKRTAQESFDPPAFMVRRSMPWGGVAEHGLYFVSYNASLAPFERMLERMAGVEDGIVDGLMQFSRPTTGGYYWCPPVRGGRIDLSAIGL